MMALINLVPKPVYAAAVAALLALSIGLGATTGVMKVQLAKAGQIYAQLETRIANENAERERVARENAIEIKRMQEKHAAFQQEALHAFRKKAAADDQRAARDRADLRELRNIVRDYATGGEREAGGDPNTCRGERDRSGRLGGLVEEALELQGESESFIRQRDREVKLLKDLLGNDRNLLTPEMKEPQ